MKKLLTLLLTLLMVFTLVGCNSTKEEEPVVVDTPQINEPVQEEIVGGFISVEDGTLTDELKAIFNKALDGLTGATYEPVELIATQVVAGTNYKFLANGTKTTNPVTKGTYYVTVYEDLNGNVSLLDIETIEEKQDPTLDPTQLSYWVVFYDQYGNEMQRTIEKYGTVPEYKTWLPEGFVKWTYKKTGKDVTTFTAITTNTYFKAVCNSTTNSSGSSDAPVPTPTPGGVNYLYFKNIGAIDTSFILGSEGSPSATFEYSNDKTSWIDMPIDTDVSVPVGETVYIKAKTNNPYMYDTSGSNGYYFYSNRSGSESLEVGGSVMTLLDPTDTLRDISGKDYCFYYLFYEMDNLKNANNLICPATKLSKYCYDGTFYGCTNLESVPTNLLPATDLTDCDGCYCEMFCNCYKLGNVPNLPATKLSQYCYNYMFYMEDDNLCLNSLPINLLPATDLTGCDYCYDSMFRNCKALINVPNLPAETLCEGCYSGMFEGSTALRTVPTDLLPATNLSEYCYQMMFYNCTYLEKAPNLPATTLVENCYNQMFFNCSNLNSIEVYFDTFSPENATTLWVKNVAATGTFNWKGATTGYSTGDNYIPSGWTVGVACLAKGTLITMADGNKKPIEDLKHGDDIRVFDHNTGKLSHAKIMDYWQYEEPMYGKMTLHFTNNIDVNIVGAHSFFNKQDNKYVTITSENVNDYIGKQFYNADSERWETLLGVTYSSEPVDTFFIATEGEFNCVAEGMLNVEDDIYSLIVNIFDYDDEMKIDNQKKAVDILKYGLFDYDDAPYLTKEGFDAFKIAYIKVAIGKGIITEEQWNEMVEENLSYESSHVSEDYSDQATKHSAR